MCTHRLITAVWISITLYRWNLQRVPVKLAFSFYASIGGALDSHRLDEKVVSARSSGPGLSLRSSSPPPPPHPPVGDSQDTQTFLKPYTNQIISAEALLAPPPHPHPATPFKLSSRRIVLILCELSQNKTVIVPYTQTCVTCEKAISNWGRFSAFFRLSEWRLLVRLWPLPPKNKTKACS